MYEYNTFQIHFLTAHKFIILWTQFFILKLLYLICVHRFEMSFVLRYNMLFFPVFQTETAFE